MPSRRVPALLGLAALAAALALAAAAGARASTWATTSSNWAGYATSRPGLGFRRASGTWVAPAAHCGSGGRRYSAVWLGLGGLHTTSKALEQVGTEADCAGGKGYYSAWYELVPAAPVPLADFGTTSFGSVRATSATGHTGTISDPAWSAVAITLSTRARGLRFTADQGSGTATPAGLSQAGDAFAVTYQAAQDAAPGAPPAT